MEKKVKRIRSNWNYPEESKMDGEKIQNNGVLWRNENIWPGKQNPVNQKINIKVTLVEK